MQGREGGAEAKKVGVVAHPRQRLFTFLPQLLGSWVMWYYTQSPQPWPQIRGSCCRSG